MRTLLWIPSLALVVMLWFAFSGCRGFSQPPFKMIRHRGVHLAASSTSEGIAPLAWEYRIDINRGEGDPLLIKELISLMEVDFGDGTGWHDVTDEWNESLKGLFDPKMRHNFEQPGEYIVVVRATFYDGEQHLSVPKTIRVT